MATETTPAFGFTLPQRGIFFGVTTVPEMLALASKADADPLFGSIWVGDSLGAKPRPDSIALLGALTAATQRVSLGAGCMASFPVRDPLVFAYQWATLDLLSNGRTLLAACTGLVGGGASAREGVPYQVADRERVARLVENIEIALATHALGTFRISFWKFGPTELRLLLAAGTLQLLNSPWSTIALRPRARTREKSRIRSRVSSA